MPSNIRTNIELFADDAKVFCNPLIEHQAFLEDLEYIEEWSEQWFLKLNITKCTVLHIGGNNPRHRYVINGSHLVSVMEQKDLGVLISADLKWETHISSVVKKANSLTYLNERAFSSKSPEFITKLYKIFIRPKLQYAQCI